MSRSGRACAERANQHDVSKIPVLRLRRDPGVCGGDGDHAQEPGAFGAVPGAGVFNSAGLWMLAEAEFLAIALVLVYVGAVMVLFLFVVMMLDINVAGTARRFRAQCAGGNPGRAGDGR